MNAKPKSSGGRRKKRPWWKPKASARSQRWAFAVVLIALVGAAWSAHSAYERLLDYPSQAMAGSAEPIAFEIPSGASFPQVLELLVEHEVLSAEDATAFKVYVLHKGAARKTTAGPHVFRGDMTPDEIIDELARKQKAVEVRVTVPEGKNILDVAQILANTGLGTAADFEATMRDRVLLDSLGI